MLKNKITKSETKYLLGFLLFLIIFVSIFVYTNWINELEQLSPNLQFVIFNLGFFALIYGALIFFATGKYIWKGVLGFYLLFLTFDIIKSPYHLSRSGDLIVGTTLGMTAPDYFVASLYNYLGVSGILLIILTYLVTPICLLLIAILIEKDVIKKIRG